jgi:hypothetical protein
MTSTGKEANGDPGNAEARYPTGEEIKFINSAEAAALWDNRVEKMAGLTWLFNDGQCKLWTSRFSVRLAYLISS